MWRRFGPMSVVILACVVGVPSRSAAVASESVRFVPGELTLLRAKAKKISEGVDDRGVRADLVTIEVHNRSKHNVEPLTFRIQPINVAGRIASLAYRAPPAVSYGRMGNAIRPGGKRKYTVLYHGSISQPRDVEVSVTQASFFVGPVSTSAPIKVGSLRTTKKASSQGVRSHVKLSNVTKHPADVVLRLTLAEPFKGTVLAGVRVPAREELTWAIDGCTLAGAFHTGGRIDNVVVRNVKLVDWTVVVDSGEKLGRTLLEQALGGWQGWPRPWKRASGSFDFKWAKDSEQVEGKGNFRLELDGSCTADTEPVLNTDRHEALCASLGRACARLRPPGLDEVLGKAGRVKILNLTKRTTIEIVGPGLPSPWARNAHARVLVLEEGRIVGSRATVDQLDTTKWNHQATPSGYLVTGHNVDTPVGRERWLVRKTAGAIQGDASLMPVDWIDEGGRMSKMRGTFRVTFSDVEVAGTKSAVRDRVVPTGSAADAVRAAWDALYRYPASPIDIRMSVRVKHPGTDDIWQSITKIEADLRLTGFDGGAWTGSDVAFANGIPTKKHKELESPLLGRLSMFPTVDTAMWPRFDVEFLGASIRAVEGKVGIFDIERGPVRQVILRNGHIDSVQLADGRRRSFVLVKVHGVRRQQETRTGDEIFRVKYVDLGDGWVVPSRIEIEGRLGSTWGPEILRLDNIKRSTK